MSERVVEGLERALSEAGLPSLESEDVYREALRRPFSSVRAARRAAIAADAPRVLAVLLEARLQELADEDGAVTISRSGDLAFVTAHADWLLLLLAPEVDNGD